MPDRVAQINAQPRWRRRMRGTALLALATLLVGLWLASAPVSQSSLAMAQDAHHSEQHGAPRIRKNVKGLTKRERQEFVQAIHALKKVRSPYDPSLYSGPGCQDTDLNHNQWIALLSYAENP